MGKDSTMTPMMQQYFAMKALHPEALLLFRCGDFYETYGDDAETTSKVLGIALTKRSSVMKEQIPMAGFPYHAIESFLPKLIRAGFKVAICDQLEDPKLTKNIVKRGITELVTPGVVLSESVLQQKENNFLAGVAFVKDLAGVALLDVSTGEFRMSCGSREYVHTLIESNEVKEIVVEKAFEKTARELFSDKYYISTLPDWAFVYDTAVERLKKQFAVKSLKGFGVDRMKEGVCAAGALLVYLEQTQHENMESICGISRIDQEDFVWMDRFTMRNLELFTPAGGDRGYSLYDSMDKTSCPMGARLLRSWITMPIMDLERLNGRYDSVEYFVSHPETLDDTRDKLSNIGDLERIISRAAAGKVLPRETLGLSRSMSLFEPLRAICVNSGVGALKQLAEAMRDTSELQVYITRTIHPQTAPALGKGDIINDGVDEELDQLRAISHNGKQYLLELQERETQRTGIPSLKVGFNNNFGYYLEVRNGHRDKVPAEWIRRQTLVGAERYITDELKEYENKILGAEDRIYQIEAAIYSEVVNRIRHTISAIQTNCRVIAQLDVLASFARIAADRSYCRPVMDDGRAIDITAGRHPVIETGMAPGEEYVPNDLHMDSTDNQIIILTGPNMAGKSALLRQTALIVLMAQMGSFVPAQSAHIGYCDKIFTRVGASDNISRGESTFMVEMLETSQILHNLSPRSLVLLDEIGRGTSTYDGMSIARAIVEFIHNDGKGAKTLFATHYHELNDMENNFSRVHNFHIAVKEVGRDVIFLRKLMPGGVAHSFGIHVARMAGMPAKVVQSAQKTLAALEAGIPADGGVQLSLFQLDDPTLGAIRDTLKEADINDMTPLQAFDLLRSLKEQLGL
ncbi:MAG: DNA mismatch repair protein MutS [Bacteroidales bacterium]|nr:DNA mismatch repair protein MutS [Candidatus Hennigimonas equi]